MRNFATNAATLLYVRNVYVYAFFEGIFDRYSRSLFSYTKRVTRYVGFLVCFSMAWKRENADSRGNSQAGWDLFAYDVMLPWRLMFDTYSGCTKYLHVLLFASRFNVFVLIGLLGNVTITELVEIRNLSFHMQLEGLQLWDNYTISGNLSK